MAARRPLVVINGRTKELPAGDDVLGFAEQLTDELGNPLTDESGNFLVTPGVTTTDLAEGENLYHTQARARAAAVADAIANGVTDVAPSQNAVFDALALKADAGVGGGGITWLTISATGTSAVKTHERVAGAFNRTLPATIAVNDYFVIHAAGGAVVVSTPHTIKRGPNTICVAGDTLTVAHGETLHLLANSTTELSIA